MSTRVEIWQLRQPAEPSFVSRATGILPSLEGMKIAWALGVSLVVYIALSLFFGDRGTVAAAELARYEMRLQENLDALESRYGRLSARVELLSSDAETIMVEARRLGYSMPGERVLELEDFDPQPRINGPGSMLQQRRPERPVPEAILRGLAAASGIATYLLLFLRSLRNKRRPGPLRRDHAPA